MYEGCITDIKGIAAGHADDKEACTGCTVIVCRNGMTAGVSVRGAAPGTRETDVLRPGNLVETIHAIVLAGGSAFGLDASSGVMQYLEGMDIGMETVFAKVPLVCSAVLYDLGVGSASKRPDAAMGMQAAKNAGQEKLLQGRFGAGAGASVGKAFGPQFAMSGGFGCASMKIGDATVAAAFAVNAIGDIYDYNSGKLIAGAFNGSFMDIFGSVTAAGNEIGTNTTIGVVATDAKLNRGQCTKLADIAHDGIALAVRPAHTMLDGDTIFGVSTGLMAADINAIYGAAVHVTARAIANACEGSAPLSSER